jgi:hypothetical protein
METEGTVDTEHGSQQIEDMIKERDGKDEEVQNRVGQRPGRG